GGGGEARVIGETPGVAVKPADVDHVRADAARSHRQMRLLIAADAERCGLAGIRRIFRIHGVRPSISNRRPRPRSSLLRARAALHTIHIAVQKIYALAGNELCNLRLAPVAELLARLVADAGQSLLPPQHGHDVEY